MPREHEGITWCEDDRDAGPFRLRQGGSSDWVTKIDPDDSRCCPPGSVDFGQLDDALVFDTIDEALTAGDTAWQVEGVHLSVEPTL
jgi:hypothetical protein